MYARRLVVVLTLVAAVVATPFVVGRLRRSHRLEPSSPSTLAPQRITRALDTAPPPPAPTPGPFDGSFDCSDLVTPAPTACAANDDGLLELVRAARAWSMGAVWCMPRGDAQPTEPAMWQQAVDRFGASDYRSLPRVERILAQNAALRLGLCASPRFEGEAKRDFERRAALIIRNLALRDAELASMGSALPEGLTQWLGPRDAWSFRVSPWFPGYHELGYGLTKRSRPLSTSNWMANVGQIVAIDSEWKPHVTSIVGSIELRRSRPDGSHQICAASLDVTWLRCKAPLGLRALSVSGDDTAEALLFATGNARVRCTSCHAEITPVSKEVANEVEARESEFSSMLTEKLGELRRALEPR